MTITPEQLASNRDLLDRGFSSAEVLAINAETRAIIEEQDVEEFMAALKVRLTELEEIPPPEVSNMDDVQQIIDTELGKHGLAESQGE